MSTTPAVAVPASNALSLAIMLALSKRVLKAGTLDEYEYEEVGKINLPLPSLEDFGIKDAVRAKDEKDPTKDAVADDGLPIYQDDALNWLFGAAVSAAKAQVRNRLISGTAEFKEGKKAAETMAELIAEGERGPGNAAALQLLREIKKSFAAFVGTLGKSVQTQAILLGLFSNKEGLSLQDNVSKGKMKVYLSQYAETLTPEDLGRYSKHLTTLEECCAESSSSDF